MVEIARALSMKSKLIVMDEPTSALSRAEVEKLFAIIRSLKAEGITTIFVTHRLEEVFEICDSYTVLRDGRHVGRGKVSETSMDGIIRLMVGRELGLLAERDQSFTTCLEVALEVKTSRKRKSTDASAIEIHDVSFRVNKGEILGIAVSSAPPAAPGRTRHLWRRPVRFGRSPRRMQAHRSRLAARCHRLGIAW